MSCIAYKVPCLFLNFFFYFLYLGDFKKVINVHGSILQEARFPQLRTLTIEDRAKLKSSFVHFDEPSFCEWMRSLKVLPPEPI